jgi:topoisomerase-4 subunit A
LESLPYEAPEEIVPEEVEVQGETNADDTDIQLDEDGQVVLF